MNSHDLGNLVELILDNKVVDQDVRLGWIKILCNEYFQLNGIINLVNELKNDYEGTSENQYVVQRIQKILGTWKP